MELFELPKSRGGDSFPPALVQNFKLIGTADATTARSLAASSTAATVIVDEGLLYRQTIKITSDGFNQWLIDVPYGPKNVAVGNYSISFDTTGGTVHITASKQTVAKFPGSARDYGGLIGVTDAKHVEGIDVVIPASKRTVSFHHPAGVITLEQMDFLESITGTVNETPFFGREAGEVLFLGAKGSEGSDVETKCDYEFAMSKNLQDAIIAGIEGVSKDGWDAYWVDHMPSTDDAGKAIRKARAIYIERVYERTDLATALGFGG